jgi:hypothetical protein
VLRAYVITCFAVLQGFARQIVKYIFDVQKWGGKTRFYGQNEMLILAVGKRRATIGKLGIIGYWMSDV